MKDEQQQQQSLPLPQRRQRQQPPSSSSSVTRQFNESISNNNSNNNQNNIKDDPKLVRTLSFRQSHNNNTNATFTGINHDLPEEENDFLKDARGEEDEEEEEELKEGFATRGEVYVPLTLITTTTTTPNQEEEEEEEVSSAIQPKEEPTTNLKVEKVISTFYCSIPHTSPSSSSFTTTTKTKTNKTRGRKWNASFGGKTRVRENIGFTNNIFMLKCLNALGEKKKSSIGGVAVVDCGVCGELSGDGASAVSFGSKAALTKNTTIKFHVKQSTLLKKGSPPPSSSPLTSIPIRIKKIMIFSFTTETLLIPDKLKGSVMINCATSPKYYPHYVFQEPSIGRIVLESVHPRSYRSKNISQPKIVLDWNPSQSLPFYYGNILFPTPSSSSTSLHRSFGFLRSSHRLLSLSYSQDLKYGQSIALTAGFGGGGGKQQRLANYGRVSRAASILESLFGGGGLDTSLLWTRKTSKFASISVGVRHDSSLPSNVKSGGNSAMMPPKTGYGCLAWLFRIQRGDFNLDIPISFIGDNVTNGGLMSYMTQALYLGFVSFLIDSAIDDLFGRNGRLVSMISSSSSTLSAGAQNDGQSEEQKLRKEEAMLNSHSSKAREDAESQALLMSRQASIKRRTEEKKDGLVIVKAVYMIGDDRIDNYDEDEKKEEDERIISMDVTTQLQFWVVDSKLQLPSSSKSQMLGFYDLTMEYCDDDDDDAFENGYFGSFLFNHSFRSWLQKQWVYNYWKNKETNDELSSDDAESNSINGLNNERSAGRKSHFTKKKKQVPILKIEYKMGGSLYRIVIRDNEPLILPSANAAFIGI